MKSAILVRRKGVNYYTDYTEYYLHLAMSEFGYYLVKDDTYCDAAVYAHISGNEKYMEFESELFDDMTPDDKKHLLTEIGTYFKSEALEVRYDASLNKASKHEYVFFFSRTHSAYDEPPLIFDEKPRFKLTSHDLCCTEDRPYMLEFLNCGGAFEGIEIEIRPKHSDVELTVDHAVIIYYAGKDEIRKDVSFLHEGDVWHCVDEDISMNSGVNVKSAVWRAKKRADEFERRSVKILLYLSGSVQGICDMDISIESL